MKFRGIGPNRTVSDKSRGIEGIVDGGPRDVVNDNVDHQVHSPVVKSFTERLEIVGGTETRVENTRIIDPVAVVSIMVRSVAVGVF